MLRDPCAGLLTGELLSSFFHGVGLLLALNIGCAALLEERFLPRALAEALHRALDSSPGALWSEPKEHIKEVWTPRLTGQRTA